LLAAMIISDAGFKICYLGVDLPPEEIAEAARRSQALAVAIGLVNGENRQEATDGLRQVEESLPGDTEIWLGGSDAPAVAALLGPTRALVIPDPQTMDSEIRRLRTRAAASRISQK
jgi:methylmalonyl-CoA mutase cobalamin-binding subunit